VLALQHGGLRFGVLALTFSRNALMTFWPASITLFDTLVRLRGGFRGGAVISTFVLRPRQAAHASETRCLFGGSDVVSPRGAVDGKSVRNMGR
jgi:hypothetical protein